MRFTIKAKMTMTFGLLIAVTIACAAVGMRGASMVASMQNDLLTGAVHQDGYASNLARAFDTPAPKMTAARRPATAALRKPVGKASAAGSVSAQQTRVKGFALDLSMGGPDDGDADFKESA